MRETAAIAKLIHSAGDWYILKEIDTTVGKSFFQKLFKQSNPLYVGVSTEKVFTENGSVGYGLPEVIEPVGDYVVARFPAPLVIKVRERLFNEDIKNAI